MLFPMIPKAFHYLSGEELCYWLGSNRVAFKFDVNIVVFLLGLLANSEKQQHHTPFYAKEMSTESQRRFRLVPSHAF